MARIIRPSPDGSGGSARKTEESLLVTPREAKEHLRVPGTYLFAGMSNSGKTVGCKKVLSMMPKRFDRIYVFSQTAHITKSWSDVTQHVFPEPNYALIAAVQKKQEEWVREGKTYQIAFIFDDCAGVLNTQERSHPMNRLVTMSRHYNISLFFLVQEMTALSPVIRKNSHFIVITKVHGSDYDMMYEMQTVFDTKRDCLVMLRKFMREYNLIFFNKVDCYSARPIMVLPGKYKLKRKMSKKEDPFTKDQIDQAELTDPGTFDQVEGHASEQPLVRGE